jgi:hypothetical protein
MPSRFEIFCSEILVADIDDAFLSDDTWFGRYDVKIKKEDGQLESRILEFIEFSRDWNQQTASSPSNPPEVTEFDRFSDLISNRLWTVVSEDGERLSVANAPLFMSATELSWRLRSG